MPYTLNEMRSFISTLFFLSALWAEPAPAIAIDGRPLSIESGDRLTLYHQPGVIRKVRLRGLHFPTPGWNRMAKRHLVMLIAGKKIVVEYVTWDRDGAILGKLLFAGNDINLRLIESGMARHNPAELAPHELARYREAEQKAKQSGYGMWGTHSTDHRLRRLSHGEKIQKEVRQEKTQSY